MHSKSRHVEGTMQTPLIPSESPVVKAIREAGQQYHGEVEAAGAPRKSDLATTAHPRVWLF